MDCIKPVLANTEFKSSKNLVKFKPARGSFKQKDKVYFYETLEYDSTYLLPCYCMRLSLEFDMQHDHILKRLNFGLSYTSYVQPGDQN